jgi:predicted nuclease of predicted toxin-antitoxin system
MPIALYVDVHVPMALTEALRRSGLDVLTSQEDGTAAHEDDILLSRSVQLGRVLFTPDHDFLQIATEWQQQPRHFPGILFARQRGVSLGDLASDLELVLTCCEPEELRDRVTYLPLR